MELRAIDWKLFMFYLGGSAGRANIEVHDVQFAAARKPADAYPALRRAWFGDPGSLHLDGYALIDWVDGHDVWLDVAQSDGPHLYFVNFGGYRPGHLAEIHDFGLFAADGPEEAKRKAKRTLLVGSDQQHRDNLREIDDCLRIAQVDGLHVHLEANPAGQPSMPMWQGYRPIGRKRS